MASATSQSGLKQFIDLRTASQTTGIPYSTLRQWISEGSLPAYKVANARVRIYVEDLQALFVRIGGED